MAVEGLVLLADFAEVVAGKLYIMGGGWTEIVQIQPLTFALAARIDVPWDLTNTPLLIEARLLDQDGKPVRVDGNEVTLQNRLETGRPPGIVAGSPIAVPLAWRFQGLLLQAGRYYFVVTVDSEEVARTSFNCHVPPQGPPTPTSF